MRVEALKHLGGQTFIAEDIASVVVRDKFGNPILVAFESKINGQPVYTVSHVKDPDFNRVLAGLGINQVVVCDNLKLIKADGLEPLIG